MKNFIKSTGRITAAAFAFVMALTTMSAGSGDPVSGVEVSLEGSAGKRMTATTDKNGEFDFANMDKGTYTVRVRCVSGDCVAAREASGVEIHFSSEVSEPDETGKNRKNDEDDNEGNKKKKEGMTSGKRQHKPITLTRDWSSVSTVTVDRNGSSVSGEITTMKK